MINGDWGGPKVSELHLIINSTFFEGFCPLDRAESSLVKLRMFYGCSLERFNAVRASEDWKDKSGHHQSELAIVRTEELNN